MGENFAAILKRTDIEKGVYIRPFENVCPCFLSETYHRISIN